MTKIFRRPLKALSIVLLATGFFCLAPQTAKAQTAAAADDSVRQALTDSLAQEAALLAARGNTAHLRPLFRAAGQDFPTHVRLYCEMALARADHHWERVMTCIDSLRERYAYQFDIKGLLSLSMLKAETLHRMGRYAELAAYCKQEITYYYRRQVRRMMLDPFRELQKKGERLSGNDERTLALRLVDLDDANALRAQYGERLKDFDAYAALRCRLTLAAAFHRPAEAACVADSLLRHYADSLDDQDLNRCVRLAAQALTVCGEWQKLGNLAALMSQTGRAEAASLPFFAKLGASLSDYPPTSVERPAADVTLPVTYVWPPLLEGRIGDDEEPVRFNLNTGQPYTLLTAADAQRDGVHLLPDSIDFVSDMGLIKASPALVDRLAFGDIVLHHALVFVATDSLDAPDEFVRTLGLLDLSRFGTVDYSGEKLIVRAEGAAENTETDAPNLRLTADGNLMLTGEVGDSTYTFLLNSGYPVSLASPDFCETTQADTTDFCLRLNGLETLPTSLTVENTQRLDCDGILGQSFLQDNRRVRFDFDRMTLTTYPTATEVTDFSSPFFMLRNLAAYDLTFDDQWSVYDYPLTFALLFNRPEAVRDAANQLTATQFKQLAADDQLAVRAMQQEAWAQLGEYTKAAAVDTKGMDTDARKRQLVYKVFPTAAPVLSLKGQTALAYTDSATLSTPAVINRKATEVRPDFSLDMQTPVVLSAKLAKKFKVKVLYQPADKAHADSYGLIDSLRLGDAVVRNVFCRIKPGKGTEVHYGLGLLHHFPTVGFGEGRLILSALSPTDGNAARMVLCDGLLAEGETPSGYVTFAVRTPQGPLQTQRVAELPFTLAGQTLPADGRFKAVTTFSETVDGTAVVLPLRQLVDDFGGVTLDFQNMSLRLGAPASK
ncbi:MAG: hypothetical protein Q4E59_03555 [Bacteroidales bacterium]|nr:hypothetical protein [Bacteroidales bacterium]